MTEIRSAPVGTPIPTTPTVYDENWRPIGTLDEIEFDHGGVFPAGRLMVNNTGNPIRFRPPSADDLVGPGKPYGSYLELASAFSQLRPTPKSSLIDIGSDGIGRCRLCSYTYIARPQWPGSWLLPEVLPDPTPPRPNRAARRRNH